MSKPSIFALMLVCVFVMGACSIEKRTKLTEGNVDQVLQRIKRNNELNDDQLALFQAALTRRRASGERFHGETVGQVIEEQRGWNAKLEREQRESEEREKQLASQTATKEAEFRKLVSVTVFNMMPINSSSINGLNVSYEYENTSSKDISSFEGTLIFRDISDRKLEEVPIHVFSLIKAGKSGTLSERYFMRYDNLINKQADEVKTEWKPQRIVFSDGTEAHL